MRKHDVTLFMMLSLLIITISCLGNSGKAQYATEKQDSMKTKMYSSPQEEAKALALPVDQLQSFPKHLKKKRAAAVTLSRYVELKDKQYKLTISKDEAAKLGVTADLYDDIATELENTNKKIKELIKSGIEIELPDVKKAAMEAGK